VEHGFRKGIGVVLGLDAAGYQQASHLVVPLVHSQGQSVVVGLRRGSEVQQGADHLGLACDYRTTNVSFNIARTARTARTALMSAKNEP
jgi:hypothetical protein